MKNLPVLSTSIFVGFAMHALACGGGGASQPTGPEGGGGATNAGGAAGGGTTGAGGDDAGQGGGVAPEGGTGSGGYGGAAGTANPGAGGAGTGGDAGIDGLGGAVADAQPVTSCTGQADFMPCTVVTTPDRKYDICVGGACVSPGCGDTSCNTPGPHFPLADTGDRECITSYPTCLSAACPSPGDSLYGQDAQYGWDTTHSDSDRATVDLTVNAEPVVIDRVTGLMWQGCPAGLSDSSCSTGTVAKYAWVDAVAYCDSLEWGGYGDWHLPDFYELDSLNSAVLPSFQVSWSSTTAAMLLPAAAGSEAWELGAPLPKTNLEPAQCVRGGTTVTSARFARDTSTADEPTVVDHATNLMWQGCAIGHSGSDCATLQYPTSPAFATLYWSDALSYCEGLSWGGHSDWRLPNLKELQSIVDTRFYGPAIDAVAFPTTEPGDYWSSTPAEGIGQGDCLAGLVGFANGSVIGATDTNRNAWARCVRDTE